jgi:hypothetical protein
MTYKIISSNGESFDIDIVTNNDTKMEDTITSKRFLDFINLNADNIQITDSIREVYNYLWSNEEQFTSVLLKQSSMNF